MPSDELLSAALWRTNFDYLLEAEIVRCWVQRERGPGDGFDPPWLTSAEFALRVRIYKPPFRTPFWQGSVATTYHDPQIASSQPVETCAGLYDEPGQVLSVALTRAIGGVFRRSDLHTLVEEDDVGRRAR